MTIKQEDGVLRLSLYVTASVTWVTSHSSVCWGLHRISLMELPTVFADIIIEILKCLGSIIITGSEQSQ